MWIIIKIEMERAFRSWGMKIAVITGLIISFSQFVLDVLPIVRNPLASYVPDAPVMIENTFNNWLGGNINNSLQILVAVMPILIVLPYAVTYYTDSSDGFIKNYYTRVSRSGYLIAKIIAVFVSAGFVAVLPYISNFLLTSAFLPSMQPHPCGLYSVLCNALWSEIFYSNVYFYMILMTMMIFVMAGLTACLTLTVSLFANNRFVALLFPFLFCNCINALSDYLGGRGSLIWTGLAFSKIFDFSQSRWNYGSGIALMGAILFVSGVLLFYSVGRKRDAF